MLALCSHNFSGFADSIFFLLLLHLHLLFHFPVTPNFIYWHHCLITTIAVVRLLLFCWTHFGHFFLYFFPFLIFLNKFFSLSLSSYYYIHSLHGVATKLKLVATFTSKSGMITCARAFVCKNDKDVNKKKKRMKSTKNHAPNNQQSSTNRTAPNTRTENIYILHN